MVKYVNEHHCCKEYVRTIHHHPEQLLLILNLHPQTAVFFVFFAISLRLAVVRRLRSLHPQTVLCFQVSSLRLAVVRTRILLSAVERELRAHYLAGRWREALDEET